MKEYRITFNRKDSRGYTISSEDFYCEFANMQQAEEFAKNEWSEYVDNYEVDYSIEEMPCYLIVIASCDEILESCYTYDEALARIREMEESDKKEFDKIERGYYAIFNNDTCECEVIY